MFAVNESKLSKIQSMRTVPDFRQSPWRCPICSFFADLVEIDSSGLDAEEPGHDCPKYRGDNQTVKQKTRANRSQQDGKQKRGCHRADLGKAAAKPAPAPRIAVGKTSPASR